MATSLLGGKFGVITGGGAGIGKAICGKLAGHGAKLVVVDLNREKAEEVAKGLGGGHYGFGCDVSKSAEVQKLRDFVANTIKMNPHIVVNCAGITNDSTLLKMSEAKFDSVVAVNLKGVFLVSQAFAKLAVQNNSPQSIVNVSSIIGKVGNFGQSNYAATKAAVIAFSKSSAKELAKKNIRVNCVLPGFIKTEMTEAMPPDVLAKICTQIPMGRMGESEEIANAVLYLASDMSKYVTGAELEVTGGLYM
uniref:Estradiol 17-beta-dehydrogenase 8 n=1 Tax=Rhabditophanes sp. KR3021 TaxID=114890 RepID=A0AC35U1J5_9BILA